MRIVKSETGRQFNVRGLTRGEVKALRADGVDLLDITRTNSEEALDRVLKLVLSDHEYDALDGMLYRVSMDVFEAVLKETFGSRDEEKNLSWSGPGTQTATG